MAEGLEELPDGQFQPPMALNCQESVFRDRLKQKIGRTATLTRSANLTRSLNGRGPCHYCGPCERGSSPSLTSIPLSPLSPTQSSPGIVL